MQDTGDTKIGDRVPCLSGVVWTPCSVGSPSLHTFCCWTGLSSHSIEQSRPLGGNKQNDQFTQAAGLKPTHSVSRQV